MNRSKRVLVALGFVVLALVIVACNQAAVIPVVETDDAIRQIIKDYKSWTLVGKPHHITAYDMSLCRGPTQEEILLEEMHGGTISVYVNPAALAPITKDENPIFPVGSVIVKEKLRDSQTSSWGFMLKRDEGFIPDTDIGMSWGLMIKREKGFNPAGGDWEYLYVTEDNKMLRGSELTFSAIPRDPFGTIKDGKLEFTPRSDLTHCQSCHYERGKDSVFVQRYR